MHEFKLRPPASIANPDDWVNEKNRHAKDARDGMVDEMKESIGESLVGALNSPVHMASSSH
jgi:hypothetical protein